MRGYQRGSGVAFRRLGEDSVRLQTPRRSNRVKRIFVIATLAVAFAGLTVSAAGATPAPNTVCAKNCAFTSIQAAINAASPGATITIRPGHYAENVTVTTPVTLKGSGKRTVLYPALSNPAPNGCGGTLCGGTASNIILVAANNVTIENMTLDGANPALAGSGALVHGAHINARNGIIDDWAVGDFTNLTVTKGVVQDIYLRGMEATYDNVPGQTFKFTHDTVTNVQGDPSSIAMFNFGDSGVMSDNKVTNANDAISANWSTGTQFLRNHITNSGSGVHTDNNGGSGGVADVIKFNNVSHCNADGFGVFVFAPYVSATVTSNTVKGCYVGLAAYGSQVSGQGPTFSHNTLVGTGAATTDPNGTYGAYLTTDLLGFAFGDLTATLTNNSFTNFHTGMFVTQTTPTAGQSAGGQATVTASPNNSFVRNTAGANGGPGTVVNAQNDWWGCPKGPNMGGGCNTATGTVQFTPSLTHKPPKP